jgi:hypothetical protein
MIGDRAEKYNRRGMNKGSIPFRLPSVSPLNPMRVHTGNKPRHWYNDAYSPERVCRCASAGVKQPDI